MIKKRSAFSFIELSVVVVIVAIIIVGVTQSSRLIKKSRLSSAQILTQNSVVNNFDNLVAWFETSLENSFIPSEVVDDGSSVSTWHDNNPKALNRNSATQASASSQPKFYADIFNSGIPAIRFDGIDDFLTFDGSNLANSAYTIFVVEQRKSNASNNFFLGGTNLILNANLFLGYSANTTLTQGHYANNMDIVISAFTTPSAQIHSFAFDTSGGKNYWRNGTLISSAAAQTSTLTSYVGAALGRYNTSYYNGDIAEIIILKSKLKTEERRAVESYLGKKYNITIS